MPQLTPIRFTVPITPAVVSNVQDVGAFEIVAFQMPADWTAATISLKAAPFLAGGSPGNSVLQDVVDSDGDAVTLTVDADQYVVLTPAHLVALYGVSRLQLVVSAAQAAAREVIALGVRRD